MAHYKNITLAEIDPVLTVLGFMPMTLPNTYEWVYGKIVRHGNLPLSLRIYTGIGSNGESREVGTDAIRLCLFVKDKAGNPKLIGVQRRVHRVEGWQKNLEQRIHTWQDLVGPVCQCGSLMVERHARNNPKSKFWGCSDYPTCKLTRSIEKTRV